MALLSNPNQRGGGTGTRDRRDCLPLPDRDIVVLYHTLREGRLVEYIEP